MLKQTSSTRSLLLNELPFLQDPSGYGIVYEYLAMIVRSLPEL